METAGRTALKNQPEIVDLLQVLMENGLKKEQREVESLVTYLDSMEEQFGQVLLELQEIREQLGQMKDSGAKTSVQRFVKQAGEQVQEVGRQFHTVQNNLIQSAKQAGEVFREKGTDALRKTVAAMKIPSAFARLEQGLHRAMEYMNHHAEKMAVLGSELHVAGSHARNIGRIFVGKAAKEVEPQMPDRGVTAKIRKSFLVMSGRFSSMEQTTIHVKKRLEQFVKKEEMKPSVKGELKKLKEEKKIRPQLSAPVKEKARE